MFLVLSNFNFILYNIFIKWEWKRADFNTYKYIHLWIIKHTYMATLFIISYNYSVDEYVF